MYAQYAPGPEYTSNYAPISNYAHAPKYAPAPEPVCPRWEGREREGERIFRNFNYSITGLCVVGTCLRVCLCVCARACIFGACTHTRTAHVSLGHVSLAPTRAHTTLASSHSHALA